MTNAATTTVRPGRYTGPTLQADPKDQARAALRTLAASGSICTPAAPAAPKQTRADIDAARTAAAIADLAAAGGIVARGAWQVGTGNYKKARAVPAGAQEFFNGQTSAPANVAAWFVAHPRAQRCVAIVEAA